MRLATQGLLHSTRQRLFQRHELAPDEGVAQQGDADSIAPLPLELPVVPHARAIEGREPILHFDGAARSRLVDQPLHLGTAIKRLVHAAVTHPPLAVVVGL